MCLVLVEHHVSPEVGKLALKSYALHKWNNLQTLLKIDELIPFFNLNLFIDLEM